MQEIDGKQCVTELLTDFWSHISWAGIANEGGVKLKNGKKPEKLIKQILEISTEKEDIVLDYHLGSGTTAAVAHKMGRRYIGIEQLDYGKNDSVARLKKVILGEQSGVSKIVNWQGGGSFVYCELAKANQNFVDEIEKAISSDVLLDIWKRMQETGFLSWKIDPKTIDENAKDFSDLSVDDAKRFLIECLDKNLLYVPYSEIDNSEFRISDDDKKINKQFYS
jgi:adenine-specific DNA-methyltransferase